MKKRKKDKTYLKFIIFFMIAGLVSITLLGVLTYQYTKNHYSYEDLELKRYTFLSYERKRIGGKTETKDYIYVKEEEKPLTILKTVRGAYEIKDFDTLNNGDVIYCYVTDYKAYDASYYVIEIKANEKVILSLKDYNQALNENNLFGIIM
ncbi:MAG: hypothetical protein K2N42_02435, partial [Anaeroplasmataceae bacterium]|nr:hypothetical protein [Anaeroplasmataceae bacterium]